MTQSLPCVLADDITQGHRTLKEEVVRNYRRHRYAGVALATALVAPGLLGIWGCEAAVAQDAMVDAEDGWRWSITPYVWGSDIQTDVRFPSGQEISGTASFDDIMDHLEITAMAHAEGHRGEWGLFLDVTYLEVADDGARGPIATHSEMDTGIYEIAGVYTPGGESGPFSLFAGARILDLGLDMTFTGQGPLGIVAQRSADDTFTDFMLGGRYVFPFAERWLLNLRGDVGGGDSELSWNALALIGWRFGGDRDNAVLVGWRHLEMEFENAGLETDLTIDGPIAGVLFSF